MTKFQSAKYQVTKNQDESHTVRRLTDGQSIQFLGDVSGNHVIRNATLNDKVLDFYALEDSWFM